MIARWTACADWKASGSSDSVTVTPAARSAATLSAKSFFCAAAAACQSGGRTAARRGGRASGAHSAGSGRAEAAHAEASSAASVTLRANTPNVSRVGAYGMTPSAEMTPWLGLYPTTPQYAAGRTTEPLVCDPSAPQTMPAATAAGEPIEEPPGVCAGFHGLRVLRGV